MSRKIIAIVLLLIISILAVSCAASSNSDIDVLKKQIESLQKEMDELKGKSPTTSAEAGQSTTTVANSTTTAMTVATTQSTPTFSINENINVPDVCDFSIKSFAFTDVVNPPKFKGFESWFEIKDSSRTYLYIVSSYKSLGADPIDLDDIYNVSFKYSEKYTFIGFTVGEEDGGESFWYYPYPAPLTPSTLHTLIEVPDEVANSSESMDCIVTVDGVEYIITLR